MNFGDQLILAFRSYGQVFRTLDSYRLWSILILPSILSLVIAILIGFLAWITSDDILYYLTGKYPSVNLGELKSNVFELITSIAVRGITLFLYLKIYRYLILIILSPVFVNISKVLQKKVRGEDQRMNIWSYCFCSIRGIQFALRNFVLDLLITLALLIVSIIIIWIFPLIPLIIMIAESYLFAMVLIDYRLEMDGKNMRNTITFCRTYPVMVIGIGLIFNLILLVPLLGVIFGPVLAMLAAQEGVNIIQESDSHGH